MDDWFAVVQYCLSNKSVPTVLMYETTNRSMVGQHHGDRYLLTSDKIEELQLVAMNQDMYLDPFIGDTKFMEEQKLLLETFQQHKPTLKLDEPHLLMPSPTHPLMGSGTSEEFKMGDTSIEDLSMINMDG